MGFEKGNRTWNKGKRLSKAHIQHMRESGAGFQVGQDPWNKGKATSEETKAKLRQKMKENVANGMVPWNKGGRLSEEHKQKIRDSIVAKYHPEFQAEEPKKGIFSFLFGR